MEKKCIYFDVFLTERGERMCQSLSFSLSLPPLQGAHAPESKWEGSISVFPSRSRYPHSQFCFSSRLCNFRILIVTMNIYFDFDYKVVNIDKVFFAYTYFDYGL